MQNSVALVWPGCVSENPKILLTLEFTVLNDPQQNLHPCLRDLTG